MLFLVYTGGLMFVLRMWGSNVTHKSPVATMIVSSLLSAIGLYWLGALDSSSSAVVALIAATLFGIGKTFLWPTMIGITAEQFPRGGALLLSLMGGTGLLSVAIVLPIMGARMDQLRARRRAADGGGARRHPHGDLRRALALLQIAGRISRRRNYRRGCHR